MIFREYAQNREMDLKSYKICDKMKYMFVGGSAVPSFWAVEMEEL